MPWVYNAQLDAFEIYHQVNETDTTDSTSPLALGLPALGNALSGSIGTALSKVILYPLDLSITRLQVQRQLAKASEDAETESRYKGIADALHKIYGEEGGISALYSGVVDDTGKNAADSFLFFLAYTFLRKTRQNSLYSSASNGKRIHLSLFDELAVGMLAGSFAKLCTTPIQNVVTRKQTSSMISDEKLSTGTIMKQILHTKGPAGLWAGYTASLVLTFNPALTMLLHEGLLRILAPRRKRTDPGAAVTFILAAVSKALAGCITYPFSLSKTRMMISAGSSSSEQSARPEEEKREVTDERPGEKAREIAAKKSRKPSPTVYATIMKIVAEEGVFGLYAGLSGDILKGFLSHGTTMLVKERIQKVLVWLWLLGVKVVRRNGGVRQTADAVRENIEEKADAVRENLTERAEESRVSILNAWDGMREDVVQGMKKVRLVNGGDDNK